MDPSLLLAPILLAAPLAAGAAVLALAGIRPRDDRIGYWAWAYLAGSLAWAVLLWVSVAVGLEHLGWVAAAAAALLAAIYLRRRARGRRPDAPPKAPPADAGAAGDRRRARPTAEGVLWALVLGASLVVTGDRMIRADSRAIVGRDEAHIWAAKAKVLYVAGGMNDALQDLLGSDSIVYHRDYPLLNPLLQLGSFTAAGGIHQVGNRVPIQGFFLALVLAAAAALRRVARPALAAGLLWLLVTAPVSRTLTSHALADHLVALGLLVTMDAWWRFRESGAVRWWRLAVLALAFTAWSKNEGLMLAAVTVGVLAASLVWDRELRRLLADRAQALWLLLPAAIVVGQGLWNAYLGLSNDLVNPGLPARLAERFADQAPVVAGHFLDKMLLDPVATQLLFALFALWLGLFFRRLAASDLGPFAAVVILALGADFLVYASTVHDVRWHLGTSSDRVLFQLMPAVAVWVAAAAGRVLPFTRPLPVPAVPAVPRPPGSGRRERGRSGPSTS